VHCTHNTCGRHAVPGIVYMAAAACFRGSCERTALGVNAALPRGVAGAAAAGRMVSSGLGDTLMDSSAGRARAGSGGISLICPRNDCPNCSWMLPGPGVDTIFTGTANAALG
jgi:hypothetical protein